MQHRRNFQEKERSQENSFASLSTLESKGHPCGILIARDWNNYAATPPPLPVTPTVAMDWSANNNKKQRGKGKPYFGKKKMDGKWSFVEPKSERKIKDRCNCKLSLKDNAKLQCEKLPDEER
ncbi:hypothetical protein TNIN_176171 [Trichonephila inaurata madagascariensis]|uniref:Uncharacterized protein n=1 Tax=Trichonephila inaurata madagascariensis TaxID=2747483 RepID=A0A8X6YQI6_9ARAC|nr:hypothetical protein TNIN_176171 [Trichonephila inaurata madagascariensis]